MDLSNTKPIVTRRLGVDDLVSFRLADFYPDIEPGDLYAVQIHGYMALSSSHMSVQHRKGQAVVHVGHTLILVSDGWTGTPNSVFRASKLPFPPSTEEAYHLHAVVTYAPVSHLLCQNTVTPRYAVVRLEASCRLAAVIRKCTGHL